MATKNSFKIEIPKRGNTCCRGSEKFSSGMTVFSVVNLLESGCYERRDYCPTCWALEERCEGIHWKTVIPFTAKIDDSPAVQKEEKAYKLLKEKLLSANDNILAEAFILALYLARKRLLVLRKEQKFNDGRHVMLYEWMHDEEFIHVPRINLASCNLEAIQQQIAAELAG